MAFVRRISGLVLVAGVMVAGLASSPVFASDWTITLGVDGRIQPSYEGSSRYVLAPVPLIDIRRAGTPRRFKSTRDGASIGILESGTFRAGLTGKVRFPRRESADSHLAGLGNVDWAVEAGVFGEFWPVHWLRTRAEIRQGFGGHHGVVSDLSADLVYQPTSVLTLSAGPRLALASAKALEPYFGITPSQSVTSGYPVYSPKGGLRSYGLGAEARYQFTPRWAGHFFVEYERLSSTAADSPLVAMRGDPDQVTVGIGATYSFDLGL